MVIQISGRDKQHVNRKKNIKIANVTQVAQQEYKCFRNFNFTSVANGSSSKTYFLGGNIRKMVWMKSVDFQQIVSRFVVFVEAILRRKGIFFATWHKTQREASPATLLSNPLSNFIIWFEFQAMTKCRQCLLECKTLSMQEQGKITCRTTFRMSTNIFSS